MLPRLLLTLTVLVTAAGCCLSPIGPSDVDGDNNNNGNPTNPGGGNPNATCGVGSPIQGTMTARIDGVQFTASCMTAAQYSNGILAIGGVNSANPYTSVAFAVLVSGPSTHQIGGLSGANAVINMSGTTATWQALAGQGSGTIVVTSLTATGAAGTFSFVAPPTPNSGATGTKTVTDGTFNVTFLPSGS
jgi:hypothetical protein